MTRLRSFERLAGYVSDALVTAGFGLFITLVAAQSASLADFGEFSLVLALVSMQTALAAFGLPSLLYGRAASRPIVAKRFIGSVIFISLFIALAMYLLTLFGLLLFADGTLTLLYGCAGLRILGTFGTLMTQDAMARHALSEFLPVRLIIASIAVATATVAFFLGLPLYVIALIWGGESLCFAVVLLLTQIRHRAKLDRRNLFAPYLVKAAPFAIQSIFVVIYMRFDQVYVAWRFGDEALGLYAAAARVSELGNLGFGIIGLLISPSVITQMMGARKLNRDMRHIFIGIAFLTAAAVVTAWAVGGLLMQTLFGSAYASGGLILTTYLGSVCFVVYGSIGSRVLAARGNSLPLVWAGFIGAVSNVIFSVALAEVIGLEGVALATVLSYALSTWTIWLFIRSPIGFYPVIKRA